jgi:uncharacterized iron-regulated membrane protein
MARRSYAAHRWLGLVIGVQLAAWCVGGLVFATHDIAWVRGEAGRARGEAPALDLARVRIAPAEAAARLAGAGAITQVVVRPFLGRPVYEISHGDDVSLVDAETGALLSPVDRDTAIAIARADRAGSPEIREAVLLERDPPSEYREGALPAWRVVIDDGEDTHVYVAARTGRITARRNDAWRRFDFFWMLHTMDYRGRDDFNHPLLIVAAAAAVVALGSGYWLWGIRLYRRRRRQAATARRSREEPS